MGTPSKLFRVKYILQGSVEFEVEAESAEQAEEAAHEHLGKTTFNEELIEVIRDFEIVELLSDGAEEPVELPDAA